MELASIVMSVIAVLIVLWRDVLRERFLRPNLVVDCSLDEPVSRGSDVGWPMQVLDEPYKSRMAFWARLRVTNKGRSTARHCEAVLAEVRAPDGTPDHCYDPLALRWAISPHSEGLKPIDIAPRRQIDLNLFNTTEGESVASIATHSDPIGAKVEFAPGDYWVKVMVYGDNFSPVERGYALRWDNTHYRKGIRIQRMDTPPRDQTRWPWHLERD